jgi:hypothetical protein
MYSAPAKMEKLFLAHFKLIAGMNLILLSGVVELPLNLLPNEYPADNDPVR